MARPSYNPKVQFTGTGLVASYNFTFKIENKTQILATVANATGSVLWEAKGDNTTYISDVVFDAELGGGTVILPAPLPSGYTLIIMEANEAPTQPYEFRNKFDFTLKRLEMALDFVLGPVQRLMYLIKRVPMLSDFDDLTGKSIKLPKAVAGGIFGWDSTGMYLRYYTADQFVSSSTGVLLLNLPTDGKFGGPGGGPTGTAGSVSGVDVGNYIHDAFDKVELILEKLAPAKPSNLSAVPLTIAGAYGARRAGTGDLDYCTDLANPVVASSLPFFDGDAGILSATMDAVAAGSITLSTGSDVGTNLQLQITEDSDPYAGVAGKSNFWRQLRAQINAATLTVGLHVAQMIHSTSGGRSLSFYVDDPGTVGVDTVGATAFGTVASISGVQAFRGGATIAVTFNVTNAVRTHYNSTPAAATSSVAQAAVLWSPGTPPAAGATLSPTINLAASFSAYGENIVVSGTGYNSKGTPFTGNAATNIRVDSISNESRQKSGTGQFPTKGSGAAQFGDAYSSSDSLATNKELQLLGGQYQYPPAVDYSSKSPSGPNYSALTPDSYANMRWVTFNLGAKSAVSSVTLTINGAQNMGSSAVVSGFALYVLVDGATPTTGWVDGNAAYPGVGSPTANGDAALDVGASSATVKRVTFGTAPKTGNVWVRVGIPSGSNKSLSTVSMA